MNTKFDLLRISFLRGVSDIGERTHTKTRRRHNRVQSAVDTAALIRALPLSANPLTSAHHPGRANMKND
jgi:hypothetical protein